MPAGRPTVYDPKYCQMVQDDMADGYSLTAFAGLIGVCRETIREWCVSHPEFSVACHQGKAKQLRAWEGDGRNVAKGKGGPGASGMVSFALSNLGDGEWRNRQDHTIANPDGTNLENKTVIILPPNGRD